MSGRIFETSYAIYFKFINRSIPKSIGSDSFGRDTGSDQKYFTPATYLRHIHAVPSGLTSLSIEIIRFLNGKF